MDANGVWWRVWSTVPSGASVRVTKFVAGWLTFESDGSLKRLTPLPAHWETVTDERLELMCRAATEVRRHTGPFGQVRIDDPDEPPAGGGSPSTGH